MVHFAIVRIRILSIVFNSRREVHVLTFHFVLLLGTFWNFCEFFNKKYFLTYMGPNFIFWTPPRGRGGGLIEYFYIIVAYSNIHRHIIHRNDREIKPENMDMVLDPNRRQHRHHRRKLLHQLRPYGQGCAFLLYK